MGLSSQFHLIFVGKRIGLSQNELMERDTKTSIKGTGMLKNWGVTKKGELEIFGKENYKV